MLHKSHLGYANTKGLARGYVYWPRIDQDIEECNDCSKVTASPPKATLTSGPVEDDIWPCIHIDFCK